MKPHLIHRFSGMTAVVLHSSEDIRSRIAARLDVLGVHVEGRRDAFPDTGGDADMLILDIDLAHDDQFPWPLAQAPMPTVALIGSESPGRLAWALEREVDAFLPLSALANIYSSLVIAHSAFGDKQDRRRRDAEIARRASQRLDLIQAVLRLMSEKDIDEAVALKQLRAFAMVERISLEDAAVLYLTEQPARRRGLL